ncbi:MAG: hypothetical protein AB1611_17075 [bacterium]
MGQIGELLRNVPCAFLWNNRLMVPLWQMGLYTSIISFCLLLKRYRLGLSVSFVFCFYWGFIANRELFLGGGGSIDRFSLPFILYIAGGFIMVALSVASFFASES